MTKLFTPILLALLTLLCFKALGQGQDNKLLPQVTPQSPETASLGRYGEYEVSLFTGLPSITIPIYEAKSGSLSVPITLSYHASGIKVTDQSSWVGLGWSLSTGGSVSRVVKGNPDEHGYLGPDGYRPVVDDCNEMDLAYLRMVANGGGDAEPDLFSYNFPGKSGKFIIQPNNPDPYKNVMTMPYAPIVIERPNGFQSFNIKDENGIQYKFGIDKNGQSRVESSNFAISSWMLTEMKAPNSDDYIEFTYRADGQVQFSDLSSIITVTDPVFEPHTNFPIITPGTINHGGATAVLYPEFIYFENGYIKFVPAAPGNFRKDIALNQRALDRIEVYEVVGGQANKIRTIKFLNDSYFVNAVGIEVGLKLSGLQIIDGNENESHSYKFQYHTDTFSWGQGGSNYLHARDLWGYYNGAISNTTLVPPQTISLYNNGAPSYNMTIGSANRNTNPAYLTEGVLKKIIYPTGGFTEFSFEPNKYLDGSQERIVGGLRVKTIKSFDGISAEPITKTYEYGLNESGYGVKNFNESASYFGITNYSTRYDQQIGSCYANRTRTFASSTNLQLESFEGSPVFYPYVTEYHGTKTNNNGRIVYEYDDGVPATDGFHTFDHSSKILRMSNSWRRGHLTKKSIFDKNSVLLEEHVNTYLSFGTDTKSVGLIAHVSIVEEHSIGKQCANTPYECPFALGTKLVIHSSYNFGTGVIKLASSTTYVHDQINNNIKIAQQKTNAYDPYFTQVLETTESSSGNEVLLTKFRYPQDFSSNNPSINQLKEKNIITVPLEKYVVRQNGNGTNARVISGQITTYKINTANSNQVVPETILVLENVSGITLNSFTVSSANAAGFSYDINYKPYATFRRYDQFGNLTELSKENNTIVSYLYGYNNTLPIAEIQNATVEEINNAINVAPSISFAGVSDKILQDRLNLLRNRLPNAMVTSFSHKPLHGVTIIADPSGKRAYFDYDAMQRLMLVKDLDENIVKQHTYKYLKQ